MTRDLTTGSEIKAIVAFTIPLIIGNLFQQFYNVADTIIVGRFIGSHALAAVGSSFTLMVFLTSIILGLCMGSGVVYSTFFGAGDEENLKKSIFTSFWFIGFVTVVINLGALLFLEPILRFIRIPPEIFDNTRTYLKIVFYGIGFTAIYNYFATLLRSLGNSLTPLIFLIIAALVNIILDLLFILPLEMGIAGAGWATLIAQAFSGLGLMVYCGFKVPQLRLKSHHRTLDRELLKTISNYSVLTSIQQSIMNFGILLVQGLVNSFGVNVMAAFAAGVKIDSFAYLPAQDFGNAFATFIAQNKGAKKYDRIERGIRSSLKLITVFCVLISVGVVIFARPLLTIFIPPHEVEILNIGVQYLRIEGSFYFLIGYLFMFYGLYRGFGSAQTSVILTIVSLGTRVVLAYALSSISSIGVWGIWVSIPIGWFLADVLGLIKMKDLLGQGKFV